MITVKKNGQEWSVKQHKEDDIWLHTIYIDGERKYGGVNMKRFTTKSFENHIKDIVILDEPSEDVSAEIDELLEKNREEARIDQERDRWIIGTEIVLILLMIYLIYIILS